MRKKKKQKKLQLPRKKAVKNRSFSIWGVLSCFLGSLYLSYFTYLLFVFRISPTLNFQYILYAFSIVPFGLIGVIMGMFALKNREQLGFAGVLFNVLGMLAYSYLWYLVMTTTPHASVQQSTPSAQ
jgi:uncharacterized Tic20 family protein